jgi:hypothetical protein
MNSLFGDATTVAATPQQRAEVESLMSGSGRGRGSERGAPRLSSEAAIPGLDIDPTDIDPPDLENGRSSPKSENGDGVGGWISNMVNKSKGDDSAGGKYKRVGQDEE